MPPPLSDAVKLIGSVAGRGPPATSDPETFATDGTVGSGRVKLPPLAGAVPEVAVVVVPVALAGVVDPDLAKAVGALPILDPAGAAEGRHLQAVARDRQTRRHGVGHRVAVAVVIVAGRVGPHRQPDRPLAATGAAIAVGDVFAIGCSYAPAACADRVPGRVMAGERSERARGGERGGREKARGAGQGSEHDLGSSSSMPAGAGTHDVTCTLIVLLAPQA